MPSSDEIVRQYREIPEKSRLLTETYLDEPVEAAQRFSKSEEFAAVLGWAVEGGCHRGRVLDLGAGPGIASYSWARAGYDAVACDPDGSEIVGLGAARSITERTGVSMSLCLGAGENLPFRGGSFSLVHVRQTLHHASDPDQLCREIFRVLQSGGVLLLTREHVVESAQELERFRQEHPLHWFTQNENAYPKHQYLRLLKDAGFRVSRVFGPFDTVVNHFPMSTSGLRARFHTALALRVGSRLADLITKSQGLQRVYARYLSMTDRTPGRLFSFVAVKP